jgi:ribosomal protein L7/L12/DNA-directed RNA polymerase subunit RPC12/RpoP
MTDTFNCSTCGAPLTVPGDTATMRCPYCSNTVIVPEALRGGSPEPTTMNTGPDPAVIQEITRIARSGKKIEAIKLYRQLTEVGLKEAKDAVEALAEGRPVEIHPVRAMPTTAGEDVSDLIRRGKKIEAIKRYREQTGVGLKEAKDAVEAMEAAQTWGNVIADQGAAIPQERPSIPTPPSVIEDSGSSQMVGCVTKILVAIIVLAILAGCLTPVLIWLFSFGGR